MTINPQLSLDNEDLKIDLIPGIEYLVPYTRESLIFLYTHEVIDFVDKKQNERLFWQAVSESNYRDNASPERREAYFDALIEKIFSKYPPKK